MVPLLHSIFIPNTEDRERRGKSADSSLGVFFSLITLAMGMFPCLHLLIPVEAEASIEKQVE